MTDEQRFDTIGYMNPVVKTPNLDALAAESLVFHNAYTTNPSCVPARAAIFTGKVPSKCLAPTFLTHLPDDEVTFQSLLRKNGYHTAAIGKQHFGNTNIDRGYDYEEIIDSHMPVNDIEKGQGKDSYQKWLFDNGFKIHTELSVEETRFSNKWTADPKFYVDEYIGERGKRWIAEDAPTNKPWYATISFPGPHMPFDGNGLPEADLYRDEDIDLPFTTVDDITNKPPHYQEQFNSGNPGRKPATDLTEAELRTTRRSYYANQSLIDRKIGEIISLLKEKGVYENTLIIYSTDHGDFMGDFGMMGKGQYLSEVLMRVPFLIKPPLSGGKAKTITDFSTTVDIAVTALSAAGIEIPDDMDGKDLNGYWDQNKEVDVQETAYMEAQELRSIRYKNWKIITYAGREYGELYDLERDPWEKENLWDDDNFLKVKTELQGKLITKLLSFEERSTYRWSVKSPAI